MWVAQNWCRWHFHEQQAISDRKMAILPLYIPTLRPIAIPGAGEHPVNCIYTRRNPIWLAGKSPIWFEEFPFDKSAWNEAISQLSMLFEPTGWKPNQRFACFYVFHGVNGVGWGGVGWVITFNCTAWHTWCYAAVRLIALPHMHDATLLYVFLHVLTYMMLRCCTSSCTSSHIWCYASVRRLALPHIHDATLLYVVLHFLTYMMQRYCMSSCTSSHIIWCYVSLR